MTRPRYTPIPRGRAPPHTLNAPRRVCDRDGKESGVPTVTTIYDVAKAADVSASTVSRVLNKRGAVDPVLAARVHAAVAALQYRPNSIARNLRLQSTSVIALIISDIKSHFFTSMARGLEDVASRAGYSVVLCNADENPNKERDYLRVAIDERFAGVILSPATADTDLSGLRDQGIPVVAIDRELCEHTVDSVLVQTRLAAERATAHLLEHGFLRIACITGPSKASTAEQRLAGYRDALRRAGVRADRTLARHTDYKERGGYAAMEALLDGPRPPDAVLVANEQMALGVVSCLADRGVRIPRDMGLVTFDDPPWARIVSPPLTAVAQPSYDVGRTAARLLLDRVLHREAAPRTVWLEAELRVRASSIRP
jgi:LacI family transcriptional regulator, galactose operon repressor